MNRRSLFPLLTLPFLKISEVHPQVPFLLDTPPKGPYLSLGMISKRDNPYAGNYVSSLKDHEGYYLAKVEQLRDSSGYGLLLIQQHWVVPVTESADGGYLQVILTQQQVGLPFPPRCRFCSASPESLLRLLEWHSQKYGWL